PHWMPEELQKRRNLRAGNDRGRIFRVVPKDFHQPKAPTFSKLSSKQLVDELANPNSWQRETAQRLLVERGDKSVGPQLQEVALHGKSPLARIHALRLLDAFDLVNENLLLRLVDDSNPRIVEQAIQVAEPRIKDMLHLRERISQLAQDNDPRVRFEALVVAMPMPPVPKHPTDQWERAAMQIAARHRSGAVLSQLLRDPADVQANIPHPKQFIVQLVRQAAGSKDAKEYLPALRALVGNHVYERVGLAGFLADLAGSGVSLDYIRSKLSDDLNHRLDHTFDSARRDADNPKLAKYVRCESIDLLAYAPNTADTLTRIATNDPNQDIRLRAIGALAKRRDFQPWKQLLSRLDVASPVEQRAILDGLFASTERTLMLLDEIEAGKVKASLVDPIHAKLLLEHRDEAIKLRAATVLASVVPADRVKVLAQYEPALKLKADPARGQMIFAKNCSICHKIGNIGVSFAPDISDLRERSPLQILTDVIQPNRAIDSNYYSYTAITTDGHVHTGVLASETSTSITLKMQEGKSETLRRNEIDELHNNGVSFMPEGLEKNIPPQEMADLISFIKNWRYLDNAQQQPVTQSAGHPSPAPAKGG
ncbi:MAG TPA: c-type cytochrome, partial [Lacipirellulaceae bacterium]|nr:c-type cytochrome [Lacipirellulaceae bacterium]